MQMQGQQIQQMAQAMDQASSVIQELQKKLEEKNDTVKAEASTAIKEIQLAQSNLKNEAIKLDADRQVFAKDKEMAKMQSQMDLFDAKKQFESEMENKNDVQIQQVLEHLSKIIQDGQSMLAQEIATGNKQTADALRIVANAVQENTKVVTQAVGESGKAALETQKKNEEAMTNLVKLVKAPRKKKLEYDNKGDPIGSIETIDIGTLQ
jgi:glucose/arabinose dehydrogenase